MHQVTGNTWDSPPAPWPTLPLIGQAYMGYLNLDAPPADFVVTDAGSWLYADTGLHVGSVIPGIIGSDFDHLTATGMPPNLQVLGHSPVEMAHGFTGGRTWNGKSYSDMTYYTRPDSHAGIFDTGNGQLDQPPDPVPGRHHLPRHAGPPDHRQPAPALRTRTRRGNQTLDPQLPGPSTPRLVTRSNRT